MSERDSMGIRPGALAAALTKPPVPQVAGIWHPITRDDDGRVYQAVWADDGKRAYWWDLDGESPVYPVEFMPHPLDPRFATATEGSGDD